MNQTKTMKSFDETLDLKTIIAGKYKLVREIGEGGMGVVYLAEQESPVRRRVTLKLIKVGLETNHLCARRYHRSMGPPL